MCCQEEDGIREAQASRGLGDVYKRQVSGRIAHHQARHDRERQSYIDHRNLRERQIIEVLEGGGAISSWDIMLQLYPHIDKRLHRAADNNVRSHLTQLEHEGSVKVYAGKPRRPKSAEKVQADIEHVRRRETVIKQAKRFEAEQRRAEIRAQENPPSAEWIEPPRYEIT